MSFNEDIKASKAIGSGDYNTAIKIYTSRLEKDENDLISLQMLACCYEWKDDKERTIEYANKALVVDPNNFSMLMVAARYWLSLNDADRTFLYACRVVDNPPIQVPEIPKWVFCILKPLSIFRRFRHFEKNTKMDLSKNDERDEDNLKWANEYKVWYEENHENKQNKTFH